MPAWPTLYPMYLEFKTEIPAPWGKAYDYANTLFKPTHTPHFSQTYDSKQARYFNSSQYYN